MTEQLSFPLLVVVFKVNKALSVSDDSIHLECHTKPRHSATQQALYISVPSSEGFIVRLGFAWYTTALNIELDFSSPPLPFFLPSSLPYFSPQMKWKMIMTLWGLTPLFRRLETVQVSWFNPLWGDLMYRCRIFIWSACCRRTFLQWRKCKICRAGFPDTD